jgi:hypothetical protein
MPFFDAGFFDSGFFEADGSAPVASGVASFGLEIAVVDPLVFDSSAGYVRWYLTARIGAVDVSGRLSGAVSISAAEDSARVASLSVTPLSETELAGYDSAAVTLDLTLFRTGQTATWRVFTGVVETVDFAADAQLASLACRDGWHEIPAACASAAEVEALFSGLASPAAKVLPWNDAEPDSVAYFQGLLATMRGATCVDSSGLWRAVPWTIGTPAATFDASEIFDGSLVLTRPNRKDVPEAITARLTHRHYRLHGMDIGLEWEAVDRVRYVVDGLPTAPKSMIQQALDSIPGWLVKGTASLVSPIPGTYGVIVGGATVPCVISPQVAEISCQEMTATIHRRWYQEIEISYGVRIDMGGLSDRDDSVAIAIASNFDAGAWEQAPSAAPSSGLYADNAPVVAVPPTGYEGLPLPHPPINGAMDHGADISSGDLTAAAEHTVARALRLASAGKRRQRLRFERPADPRWEVGAVLAINAYGVTGTGQVAELEMLLDHDSGDATSSLTLACPDGTGSTTVFTATATPPAVTVTHGGPAIILGNPVGAAFETPATPDEDLLIGFLCNVLPTSDNYDLTKPVYEPQFRIIAPEIAAEYRDPLQIDVDMTATVQIAGSGVGVTI